MSAGESSREVRSTAYTFPCLVVTYAVKPGGILIYCGPPGTCKLPIDFLFTKTFNEVVSATQS